MVRYVLRRLPSGVVVLLVASLAIFFLLRLASGDPAATLAGPDASDETVAAIRTNLGLDKPLIVQYLIWLRGIVTGNLGDSYILHAPISQLIGDSLLNTAELAVGALLLALVGGSALGYLMGTVRHRGVQNLLGAASSFAVAVPTYVTGVLLVLLF